MPHTKDALYTDWATENDGLANGAGRACEERKVGW